MTGIVTESLSALANAEAWWRVVRKAGPLTVPNEGDTFVIRAGMVGLNPENLANCSVLYVASDMVDLLRHAADTLPPYDFNPSQLPWPRAFCVLAKPIVSDDVPTSAVAWGDWATGGATHLLLGLVKSSKGAWLAPVLAATLTAGHRITDWDNGSKADGEAHDWGDFERVVCALWLLVQQKVAVQRTTSADRADQRRWGRDHDAPIPDVTVIELRRPLQSQPHEDTPVGFVDWSHRWIVDGHWRNQWHPTLNAHVPTWIAPHVKGPEDKPLVVKRKISAWVR